MKDTEDALADANIKTVFSRQIYSTGKSYLFKCRPAPLVIVLACHISRIVRVCLADAAFIFKAGCCDVVLESVFFFDLMMVWDGEKSESVRATRTSKNVIKNPFKDWWDRNTFLAGFKKKKKVFRKLKNQQRFVSWFRWWCIVQCHKHPEENRKGAPRPLTLSQMWVFVNAISFQSGLQIQNSKQSELWLINTVNGAADHKAHVGCLRCWFSVFCRGITSSSSLTGAAWVWGSCCGHTPPSAPAAAFS